ncbi:MAG: PKD domain-containing protein [Bacteroidia bacterium]|nr:PKD domain-containing protein [Bacteroidia bacterium]
MIKQKCPSIFVWILLFFTAHFTANAQPCNILSSSNKACLGASVNFSRTPASATDSAFQWDFGDGFTSNQSSPTYVFKTAGVFAVKLRVYRFGGSFCDATPFVIRVFSLPIAQFVLTTNDSLCFRNNLLQLVDSSVPGSSNAPIRRRIFLWGDGAIDQETPPYPLNLSHQYSNINGGLYRLVLEVEDTNGCIQNKIDSVFIHPFLQANFIVSQDITCNRTIAKFTNLSAYQKPGAKVTWYAGNGFITNGDSAINGFSYTYSGDTDYVPSLTIVDRFGCKDSFVSSAPVITFLLDTIIQMVPTDRQCFGNNKFLFTNSTRFGTFKWEIKHKQLAYKRDTTARIWEDVVLNHCGPYEVKLKFSYGTCTAVFDTVLFVYGPQAYIENDTLKPKNWIQCGVHDTVEFRLPDINCYYNNLGPIEFFWDFNDPFAPACTTNTKLGLNINQNCRYSQDSIAVKHYYSQPNAFCYRVMLAIRDPLIGCADTDYVDLRLQTPSAKSDYSINPPRIAVKVLNSICSNQPITVLFNALIPLCGPEKVYILPDTSCPNKLWREADSLGANRKYEFSVGEICNLDGDTTYLGVVVMNGRDAFGNQCFDTAYYPYIYKPIPILPFIVESVDSDLCKPHRFRVFLNDSIRKNIRWMVYNFNDGSPNITLNFTDNDSIIYSQYHNFENNGEYRITVGFLTKDSCFGSFVSPVIIGENAIVQVVNPFICTNQKASFNAFVRYLSDPLTAYWADESRLDAGKEAIYWNFGDGTGWINGKVAMEHQYSRAGVYFIQVATKDSLPNNCLDTFSNLNWRVRVSSVTPLINTITDTFYCAPTIVTFIDSSYSEDGSGSKDYTAIVNRLWIFHDLNTSSLINPGKFYPENGSYKVNLRAESVFGCAADTEVQVIILGPKPSFVIQGDTFGCVPFTVRLKNTTGQPIRNWIWYFNNSSANILSTNKDTDITFTYTQPGVYPIDLFGEDEIFNPNTGTTKNCSQRFPYVDPLDGYHSRRITVLPGDTLRISSVDTVCVNTPFNVSASINNNLQRINWIWGDGNRKDSVRINATATHQYAATGKFLIRLEPLIESKNQCALPAEKEIVVDIPEADFTFDATKFPTFSFTNTSQRAVRYLWDFGQPESTNNNSTETNPTYNYQFINKKYVVCLMAFDSRDCMDSVCKELPVKSKVVIPNVFTPDNADLKNDAFDIDIEGWEKYELYIYNRWGTKVFEGFKDGIRNDGINWNGRIMNDGEFCPEGVYFYVFKYKLITDTAEQVENGTITLLR